MSKRIQKFVVGLAALAAFGLGGAAIAGAAGEGEKGENDAGEQAKGPEAERAKAAALESTGGGRANAVERDSENGATWEVEVTKRDGKTVDVRLDQGYKVVVTEGDTEAEGAK
jgi:hypothetical protein